MAHYALLDENNIVTQVLYVENQFILDENGNESEELGIAQCREGLGVPDARLVKTSYNGRIRARYAGIGYSYNEEYDGFVPPKPFPSWSLNTTTLEWEPPVPKPTHNSDNTYCLWNEETLSWVIENFPPIQITQDAFRTQLTITEKILWDSPDTASTLSQKGVLVTFKEELPLNVGESETTDILDLLVSEGVYTQERLDEIISNL